MEERGAFQYTAALYYAAVGVCVVVPALCTIPDALMVYDASKERHTHKETLPKGEEIGVVIITRL